MFYKAKDPNWTEKASQGGIVRGCAQWLLDNGYIKSIIGVLQGDEPGEYYWGITDDPAKLARSVYKPLDPLPLFESLTDDDKKDSLFIGLPCQIVKGVKYKITLFCSGSRRGNIEKKVINYRYGIKPNNFGVLYEDGTYDTETKVQVTALKEACATCKLPYIGDMSVGDLHGTPFNLVETQNPLFDDYISTVEHKILTKEIHSFLKID